MATIDQPLVLENNEAKITLSGVRQLMQKLTPEQLKQLEKELQSVVNLHCTMYVGPIPE